MQLVADGTLSGRFRRDLAIVFGRGVMYLYEMAAIPIIGLTVRKADVLVTDRPTACADLDCHCP
jgi:hypothetical protein